MKKSFKTYLLVWLIFFIIFNVCAFLIPSYNNEPKFDTNFFIAYGFIVIAFIIELICGYILFSKKSLDKKFLNFSIINIGYIGLVIVLIVGILSMVIPNYPVWLSIVLGVVVIGFTIASILTTDVGISYVENVEAKIKNKIDLFKKAEKEVRYLYENETDESKKELFKQLYEKIKYSNSVTTEETNDIDNKIVAIIQEISNSLINVDNNTLKERLDNLNCLINKRSK